MAVKALPTPTSATLLPLSAALALLAYALLPLPAAVLGALAFAAVAYLRPELGLTSVLATLPTYYFPREFGGLALSLPESCLLLTAAAMTARWLRRRQQAPRATPLDRWIAIFLAAALLSLLPTEYLKLSLRSLRTLILEPVLFYYLTAAICPTRLAMRPLLAGFLGAAGTVALLAVIQALLNVNTVQVEGVRRALGLYPSPNQLALYLGYALPFAAAVAVWLPAARRWALPLTAVLALALALTFSVGGWLGSGVSLLVLAALWGRRALALTGAAALLGGSAALLLATHLGVERVLSGSTAAFRWQIWTSALAMVRDHPFLGIGLDNFLYLYQLQYILPAAWAEPNISHPHNWALQFWLELGLLGLIAVVGVIAQFIWLVVRALRTRPEGLERAIVAGSLAAVAGTLVHGSLDNSYFLVDLAILFWWQLAIAAAAARDRATGVAEVGAPATVVASGKRPVE